MMQLFVVHILYLQYYLIYKLKKYNTFDTGHNNYEAADIIVNKIINIKI